VVYHSHRKRTLSGYRTEKTIQRAKERGYTIRLYYVGLDTAQESIKRIENRVAKGGHDIPAQDVQRRFQSRFQDLIKILPYCDEAVFFDNENAFVSHLDDSVEHHILLAKADLNQNDIDKYFRIIFDKESASWTFICAPDFKGITDKTRRITTFYKDGFIAISAFLAEFGYLVEITIPKRYRRHIEILGES